MDTYISINNNCITCGDCIDACEFEGYGLLTLAIGLEDFDGYELPPMISKKYEYIPCHHCTDKFSKPAPCKEICKTNAIKISRR